MGHYRTELLSKLEKKASEDEHTKISELEIDSETRRPVDNIGGGGRPGPARPESLGFQVRIVQSVAQSCIPTELLVQSRWQCGQGPGIREWASVQLYATRMQNSDGSLS